MRNTEINDNHYIDDLIKSAYKAQENSYSPYSKFKVGAVLRTVNGRIYTGCNIENASFPAGCCAERTALFKAISDGEKNFSEIAIASSENEFCYPCGVCLQVLSEFCDPNVFNVIIIKNKNEYKILKLKELLPFGFKINSNKK